MLPNFLIIGAAKAGTTSLWAYLREHPQVFMPDRKELHFFVTEKNWERGIQWYENHFEGAEDALAIGEGSVSYTRYPISQGVPERIASVLPKVRLIYLVRHPVERMISQYRFNVSQRWEKGSPEALLTNPVYLSCSRYATQVEQYLEYFPLDRLLILRSEDLRESRASTVQRILQFLDVEDTWLPADLEKESNKTARDVRAPRKFATVLHQLPGYKAVSSVAPARLKTLKRRVALQDIGPNFLPSERVRRELEELLRPEMQRLRQYVEVGFEGWGIG
jgi:hypothetical protein